MSENIVVSVVVPIYNVEKYLDRCISSIVNQTYRGLEIILVDDGSPDKCPQLCDEWALKDERIKVIHKKNAGLGMARNTGIDHATGDYICFFDSDDYVELNAISNCVKTIEKYSPDMVLFGFNTVDNTMRVVSSTKPNTSKDYYENEEVIYYVLPNLMGPDPKTGVQTHLQMSACASLFSLQLIKENKWCFVSEREYISEDFYSLLSLYSFVKKVAIIKEAFYNYCYNGSSLTHSYRKDRFEKVCLCHKSMKEMCIKFEYPDVVMQNLDHQFLGNVIFAQKMVVTSNVNMVEKIREIRRIIKNPYLKKCILGIKQERENIKRRLYIFMIKHDRPFLCYLLLRLTILKK